MPNWVCNTITVKGKSDTIEHFLSDANKHSDGTIRFSSWIPVPETFEKYDTTNYPNGERLVIGEKVPSAENDSLLVTKELIEEYKAATKIQKEQYGVVGWYDYNCLTYGCKWDAKICVESRSEDSLTLYCETAWNEPINFLFTISERYSNLSFTMISDSAENGYCIEYLFEKGDGIILKQTEYVFDDEYEEDDVFETDNDNEEDVEQRDDELPF